MSDLVSRVLAAIEETERLANACEGRPWEERFGPSADEDEPEHWVAGLNMGDTVAVCGEDYTMARHHAAHIVHNDPAAVLRRCAADRRMVEAVQRGIEGHPGPCTNEGFEQDDGCDLHIELWKNALPERVLAYLAAGYGISAEEETPG